MTIRPLIAFVLMATTVAWALPSDAQNQRANRGKASSSPKLYRWTDAEGKVHYTDSLPTEALQQGRTEYTHGARQQTQIPRPLTAEERATQAQEAQRQAQQAQVAQQQAQEQLALRTSYPSKESIVRDFEQRRQVYEGQIVTANAMMAEHRQGLVAQLRLAADAELANKKPSDKMREDIQNRARQVQQQQNIIHAAQANINALGAEQAKMLDEWNALNRPAEPSP